MGDYWKTIALVLMAVLLWLVLDRQEKDMGLLLTLAACCAVGTAAIHYLTPIWDLIWQLNALGNLQEGILKTLLKAVGIGFVSETAGTVCKDAGNGSMASMVRFFGSAVILYVSIPLFQRMMTLIQEILGVL